MSARVEAADLASHLSSTQIQHLRHRLVEEHDLHRTRAGELHHNDDLEPDLADALLVRCQGALEEIEAALALMDQGRYGKCSKCQSPIPFERLEVVPATQRCVACQSAGRDGVR